MVLPQKSMKTRSPSRYSKRMTTFFLPVSERLPASASHGQPSRDNAHHRHEQADQACRYLATSTGNNRHLDPSTFDGPSYNGGGQKDGADRHQGRLGDLPSIRLGRLVRHA